MKSSTRLDSAIFQLTPTRTRCDLLVTANGKTEKIASGLVNPFLAHLKTAKDQVDKGGYSIILKPEAGDDSTWFTKGTIERFVRFVSTPEVLERVYTIETEIIQIKEAIRSQNNSDMVLIAREDNLQAKKPESIEGSRPLLEANEEKAIILYQPGSHPQQANGSTVPEENSKAHVLKVLETRKTVLQKEQGMAFARAVAAGFDIDDMVSLISFSRNFGASRLMDACVKFMDLWKKKHESGQWVEIAATEVMSIQPDSSAGDDSGIVLTNAASISRRDSWPGTPENNDVKSPADCKPNGHQEYLQGQLPHPMYSPWPVHSPPGAFPVFQGYPMQGMPPYPSYPGSSPYPSSYPSSNDPRYSSGRRKGRKHHSSDSEDSGSEDQDTEVRSGRRRKSGKVVIRNINYISSKKKNHSGTESDDENNDDGVTRDHLNGEERVTEGTEADSGHWQAFQTYLLADADRDEHNQMMEKEVAGKKRQSSDGYDPLVYDERDMERYQEGDIADIQSGNITRRIKGPNDEWFISRKSSGDCRMYGHSDAQYIEVDGKRVLCRKNENDDFMIRQRQHGLGNSSDPLALNGFDNLDRKSSCNVDDDSYIVPLRSPGRDESGGNKRNAIDIGSEIPSSHPTDENERKQRGNYEPHDLSLMPERGTEKLLTNYDPALDFGLETRIDKKKDVVAGAKKAVKDPRSRLVTDTADKRKASGPIRKGRSTKMSPLDEARARAEKLRTFKADLMKMKKEKEEEERKRIEALKMARQKRIAARSNSSAGQSQQVKKPLQNKFSPGTHRGSKFSDSEPGSSSPLQRFPVRTASLTSNDSQKLSKNSNLSTRSNSTGKKLTRSVSSLPLSKKDNNITSLSRTRRLSEPKMSGSGPNSSVKSRGSISSKRVSSAPESKKISAIVNYDKTKIASLPELKIKTSAGSATGNRSSTEVKTSGIKEKSLSRKDIDESPVIEKTVVMLEREKPSVSVSSISSDIEHLKIIDTRKKPEVVSECVSIRASISSEPMETSSDNANVNDIVLVRLENLSDLVTETPKFPTSQSVTEKPYEAPYARVSSLENTSTGNYSWAPPTSIPINEHEPETVKVLVPESKNTKLEKITEPSDKVQTKESTSKGLMKLLKFGRKTQNAELDNAGVNNRFESNERAVNASASSEAFTLKNLISEEETPIASAGPHKSSRHFSLLLPFKNKSTEKKITS